MFKQHDDLPLFSGTPIKGNESAFVPKQTRNTEAEQPEMFDASDVQMTPAQARAKLVQLRQQQDKDAETLALIIRLEKIASEGNNGL
jgi:thiamine monophosphate synthase